ncbi:uncharacterized protein LOC111713132 [Eurytemora carolleeae]|uniref:uncharacterized protein LOC111713132 n=1 Tax=Eurytemora carolleeae TaxID=1294199 RepID=UPI000C785895|nr:uncharacterized protein LOC111713132 [Eurytemora carolleeae]|eukprot:XP_023343700.1 uncharacterized protein LOC111713132 [Eurytemora affinis]
MSSETGSKKKLHGNYLQNKRGGNQRNKKNKTSRRKKENTNGEKKVVKSGSFSKKLSAVNQDGALGRKSKRRSRKQRKVLKKKVQISQDRQTRKEESQDHPIRKERSAMTWDEIAEWRRTWKPNPTKPGRAASRPNINYISQPILKHSIGSQQIKSSSNLVNFKNSNLLPGQSLNQPKQESISSQVSGFLQSVINKYSGGGSPIIIKNNQTSVQSKLENINGKKHHGNMEKRIRRKLKQFSKSSIDSMINLSKSEIGTLSINTKHPKTVEIPWARLKKVLKYGLRGPDVSSRGLSKFARTNFNLKSSEIQDLQRSYKKKTKLKTDQQVSAYLLPLQGDEQAFEYKAHYCDYLIKKTKKGDKKRMRKTCRRYKRKTEKEKNKRRRLKHKA